MKKKRTRRSESQFPALDPKLNLKSRAKLLDYDYVDQLSDKDKQWLNDFTTEYTNADFKTNVKEGRKRIHRKKKVEHEKNRHLKKLITDFTIHIKQLVQIIHDSQVTNTAKSKFKKTIGKFKKQLKTQIKKEFTFIEDSYKREAEYANNHRNMCILTQQESQGMAKSLDLLPERVLAKIDYEAEMIENIDNKKLGFNED